MAKFDPSALERIVSNGAGGRSARLKAASIDSLCTWALVDPLPFLAPTIKEAVQDPSTFFKLIDSQLQSDGVQSTADAMHEYAL